MGLLAGHKVFKVFMVVCALAQVAAVMPYHHHGPSDAPCINPLHALEAHGHGADRSGGSHIYGVDDECCHTGPTAGCGDQGPGEAERGCQSGCGGHFCLHNASGHGQGEGPECGFSHIDLNPPTKEALSLQAPVTDLLFATVIPEMLSGFGDTTHRQSCTQKVVGPSVYWGTMTLYHSRCSRAIPPRAPSFPV